MNAQRGHDVAALAAVRRSGSTRVLEVVGNGIVGGMEVCVLNLIERLPRERFDLQVLCPYEGPFCDQVRALGVSCQAIAMPENPLWSSVQAVSALVHAEGFDVLHAHLPNAHLLAALVGRLTGRPVLATIHGRQVSLHDLEAQRAAGTTLCTVCRASELHALGVGVDPARLERIGNGVDTARFTPPRDDASRRTARRRLWGVADEGDDRDDGALIGFVGRLSPEKAPQDFVRAALMLRERAPAARFVVVGDGPMQAELQGLIAQYRLADRVRLVGLQHDMPAVYAALDLLVSTSHSEALPLTIMEAMACGLPVVATRVGGVSDLVEHGGTGWLCDAGDFQGIAASIATVLEQAALRERMARRARERCVARFDLARQIEATSALLARLGGTSDHDAQAALTRTRS
jgi:glycosyltransferase involved in cell wall biosynthesis